MLNVSLEQRIYKMKVKSSGQKMSASLFFPDGKLVALQVPLTTQKDHASLVFLITFAAMTKEMKPV